MVPGQERRDSGSCFVISHVSILMATRLVSAFRFHRGPLVPCRLIHSSIVLFQVSTYSLSASVRQASNSLTSSGLTDLLPSSVSSFTSASDSGSSASSPVSVQYLRSYSRLAFNLDSRDLKSTSSSACPGSSWPLWAGMEATLPLSTGSRTSVSTASPGGTFSALQSC